jgi:PPK2 family polyphosphate:nucleotide phosphotransferase
MLDDEKLIPLEKFRVKPGLPVNLKDFDTDYEGKDLKKQQAEELLELGRKSLALIQDILYAHNQYGVLIIFQAMDAAGKDGAVKHVMTGFNPLGVKVYSFKAPNAEELDHDYFWRHNKAMPARGEIAIHNRSHYENVLVTRVHPEYIINENIPGIDSLDKIDDAFWQQRYEQINKLESILAENGIIVLKIFLNVSKKEQRRRFLERIDDPSKNWKFSLSDLKERGYWKDYQRAYELALEATSKDHAPWFVVPADNKWYARLVIAAVIWRQFAKLKLAYPTVTAKQKAALEDAKAVLLKEKELKKEKKARKEAEKAENEKTT